MATKDLVQLELEAKESAKQKVANLLQRSDQLERVDQFRKHAVKKKSSVEAMLKTAVQSQLDGVKTGMSQLQNALRDIKQIKQSLEDEKTVYQSIEHLNANLQQVRAENARHSQLAAANENLRHIFMVPEYVVKTEEYIDEGKLLHAHKNLMDLESSRDELLFELYKQSTPSPTDVQTVHRYFDRVEKLSESLSKQLWLILHRTISSVRREPKLIVTVLRIIEREEKKDVFWAKKKEQCNFAAPGRPRQWRQRAFGILQEAVSSRIESCQLQDPSQDPGWIVNHLSLLSSMIIEDMRIIKTLCEPCFPPYYNIVTKFTEMYHLAVSAHFQELIQDGLTVTDIVHLLKWIKVYNTEELWRHPKLNIDISEHGELLKEKQIVDLHNRYLKTLQANFTEWMGKAMTIDAQDWYREELPQKDEGGFYITSMPTNLHEMVLENLMIAADISDAVVDEAVNIILNELQNFTKTYQVAVTAYKEKHQLNRDNPRYYLEYVIANVNNFQTLERMVDKVNKEYCNPSGATPQSKERFRLLLNDFQQLVRFLYSLLTEEVFTDLAESLKGLFSKHWLGGSEPSVGIICETLLDYNRDFELVKKQYRSGFLSDLFEQILFQYFKALFGRRIIFKDYDERVKGGEMLQRDSELFRDGFRKIDPLLVEAKEKELHVFADFAEIITMRDTSVMPLILHGLFQRYPDLRSEQLINLLAIRGDIGKGDARQMVADTVDDEDGKVTGFFSKIPA